MKRPNGFDRSPEPEPEASRPASAEPRTPEWARDATPFDASAAERGDAPSIVDRFRGRRAGARRPLNASGSGTEGETAPEAGSFTSPADDGESSSGEAAVAPTVDLSDVRATHSGAETSPERWRDRGEADRVRAAERRLKAAAKQRRARLRLERKRFSAASRARRRFWIIAGGTVAALALFVAAGVFTPLMAVRDVRVEGAATVNEADISAALQRFTGVPLALIDDAEVHRALEPFPVIQRYAVERVPPHTLIVRIQERVPVLSVAGDAGVSMYDAAGVLLGTAEAAPAGVPVAGGALSDLDSDAFHSAARSLRDMPDELRAQIVGATATSAQDVTLTLASGVEVLWGDATDTRRKAVVLQTMLTALADQSVSRIDVSSSEAPVFVQ